MDIAELLAATPNELVKRYGAIKKGNVYEVPLQNAPWAIWRPFSATLMAGTAYTLKGVKASWSGLGEVYVVLTDWEAGFGYVLAQRRRMFGCIRRPYSTPYGVKLPQHMRIKPVELTLSDSDVISCVDKTVEVKALAVLPSTLNVLSTLKVEVDNVELQIAGRNL